MMTSFSTIRLLRSQPPLCLAQPIVLASRASTLSGFLQWIDNLFSFLHGIRSVVWGGGCERSEASHITKTKHPHFTTRMFVDASTMVYRFGVGGATIIISILNKITTYDKYTISDCHQYLELEGELWN